MSQKIPKLAALTAIGLTGWMLPLATPLPLPLEGFSLAMGLFSSAALSVELKRETIVSGVRQAEKKLTLERVAYQMSLEHEAELQRLRGMYGIGLDHDDYEDEDDREEQSQPALSGATIHQPAIGGGADLWNLDLLLQSNSSHLLLIGQTGSGKTTLARYLIDQLHPDKTIVLDADDDGQTWKPLTAIGTGDDWEAIDEAMNQGLEDFSQRTPNGNNPQTVYVLEELPDLVSETKTGVDFCRRILRRGRKRKMFVIALTQDPNTGTIGLSQPVQKCFSRLYLGGMARHALRNLVPRNQREALTVSLSQCQRGAIVEFLGEWFVWEVPNLTTTPGAQSTQPTNQAQQAVQSLTGDAAPTTTIAALESALRKKVEPTALHWKAIDLALSKGGLLSTRDAMRSLGIGTADEARQLFQILQGFELGETIADRLPNGTERFLFRAYPPMG